MATNNRINANAYQAFVANATQQITGIKNITTGSGIPATAVTIFPALYFDTATNLGYVNLTGAANAWIPLSSSAGGGGSYASFLKFS